MKRPNASVLSIATALCLLSASGLTGCAKSLKRPDAAPTPPAVNCDAGPAALIPPIPEDPALEAEWILAVLGLYEGEVEKRAAVMACLAELKAEGVIR